MSGYKGMILTLSDDERQRRSQAARDRNFQRILLEDHLIWTRRIETPSGCWEWTGMRYSTEHGGYGFIVRGGHRIGVHRYAWQLAFGKLADDQLVLHRCDNPPCFRPSHLFLGTQADNMQDMVAKGRSKFQRDPDAFRGDRHWAKRKPGVARENMARARQRRWR